MGRKILIGAILIIVLISLNWFRELKAQDLSSLSDRDKSLLLEKYKDNSPERSKSNLYSSPEIFHQPDSVQKQLIPPDPHDNATSQDKTVSYRNRTSLHDSDFPFEELPLFGHEMFNSSKSVERHAEIASAADYILGPGDNVIIYLWGKVEKEYNLTLDREGKVYIPKVGEITGWGITLSDFTFKVKKYLSRAYSDFEISASLGKIRSIRIYVTGEIKSPGVYTVSSLTSLFDAIYLAGGPNERGSMRQIKHMRQGKEVSKYDLYQFLLAGDNSSETKLNSGDVVFVPVSGPKVAIRGEITRPAIYELNGQERISDIIELAGKTTPRAHLDRAMLERISENRDWKVIDLDLKNSVGTEPDNPLLEDGDRLTIYSIDNFKKNKVGIFGMVRHPGYYERTDSIRISDLVTKGQLNSYDVYLKRADLVRRYANWKEELIPINLEKAINGDPMHNLLLQDLDSLYIRSIDEVQWNRFVYIEGEVKNPGRFSLYEHMTVNDLIYLAGSFAKTASKHQIEVARLDSTGTVSLFYLDLVSSMRDSTYLMEDDHIFIRSIPEWELHPLVNIDGEVKYPGDYMLSNNNETLFDIIQRAGGLGKNAFAPGIILERESIGKNLDRAMLNNIIKQSTPIVIDSLGQQVKTTQFEYDQRSLNRIILDVNKIMSSKGQEGDIVLEPDDIIFIPSIPSGITVMGAVGANGTIKFEIDRKTKDYIEMAGNFSRRADKNETKLVRANGKTISGKKALGQKVMLGDIIIVPSKIEKEKHFFKNLSSAITAATGILTSAYLISKL